jgi:hypothetical protein
MHRTPIRLTRLALVGAVLATSLVVAVPGANAACHIAGFVESEVEVATDAGSVTLTVELQGRQPPCEGTVDWATEDGTATAGSDYEAGSGTLTFVAEDDRVEEITVAILDGASAGDFSVVLSNPSGSIAGTGAAATVTITADGEPTEPAATGQATTPADEPTDGATDTPATEQPTTTADDGDGARFPWIPLLAVVIVLGLLVGWYIARRTPAGPED